MVSPLQGRIMVLRSPEEERSALQRVPLACLGLELRLLERLEHLGVQSLGEFLRLPAGGLLDRLGPEAFRLHRLASGEAWDPLKPEFEPEPVESLRVLDFPERQAERLLFLLKRMLEPLLVELHRRGEALFRIVLDMELEVGESRSESLSLAEPTLQALPILDLLRLRLESIQLDAGVVELRLRAIGVPAPREQLELFVGESRREMAAANRALARLRAELGEECVLHAVPGAGHLPEERFRWEPMERLETARARPGERFMIRRFRSQPRRLGRPPRGRSRGPFRFSGGWWRQGTRRDYYYLHTSQGEILWIYYDPDRKSWFLEGALE